MSKKLYRTRTHVKASMNGKPEIDFTLSGPWKDNLKSVKVHRKYLKKTEKDDKYMTRTHGIQRAKYD